MRPTPLYQITDEQRDSVYEPAEDTFLLLDALEKDAESEVVVLKLPDELVFLQALEQLKPNVILEIGSGTGSAAQLNSASVEAIQCDLLSALSYRLCGLVDVLLFNPPYVPTEHEATSDYDRCWAGGPTGRSAVDRLFAKLPEILAPGGFFYVVALQSNNVVDMLAHNQSAFSSKILLERRCGSEYLFVLKFTRLKY
ncbi:unnamed protein product [Litomosoides sigmodontis]|uniref:Methyltransferase small domain-containing protein n=1 Tax=Litomosoides sigmodontis TaxID=42156 RepID=A0A3P6UM81_LITSI|nr:unnamed protein product [Litomosoides sigmodontis]